MEKPLPAEMQVKTFVLNYGNAETIAKILNDLSKEDKNKPFPVTTQVPGINDPLEIFGKIEAYPEKDTSSIVVASAPVNFPAIEQIIQGLDVFPPQAMIEVVIMDVTLDDDFSMGVEMGDATTPTLTTKGYEADFVGDSHKESIFHSHIF